MEKVDGDAPTGVLSVYYIHFTRLAVGPLGVITDCAPFLFKKPNNEQAD
jgi:hypothetical protein